MMNDIGDVVVQQGSEKEREKEVKYNEQQQQCSLSSLFLTYNKYIVVCNYGAVCCLLTDSSVRE